MISSGARRHVNLDRVDLLFVEPGPGRRLREDATGIRDRENAKTRATEKSLL